MKKTVRRIVMGVILLCLCAAGYMIWQVMDIYPEGYTAEQLGIVVQHVFGDAQVLADHVLDLRCNFSLRHGNLSPYFGIS